VPALQIRQKGQHCWYVTIIKPHHGKGEIAIDADVTMSAEKEWEITLGADLEYRKIRIPAKGYPYVSDL
jgi:hypothetical protein